MSTKETLPTDEEDVIERLKYAVKLSNSLGSYYASASPETFKLAVDVITSLRTRLDAAEKELFSTHDLFDRAHERAKAAEKELEQTKERLSKVSKGTLMVENLHLKEANAELLKDRERLDWLDKHHCHQAASTSMRASGGQMSYRQAIDAATTKGQE